MDRASSPTDNPREWARPGPEGDIWHDYWEPEEVGAPRGPFRAAASIDTQPHRDARRRLARRLAILYVIVVPIAIAANLIFSRRYHSWGAVIGAVVCTIGLIRIRAYGERSVGFTVALLAFIAVWVIIAAVRLA